MSKRSGRKNTPSHRTFTQRVVTSPPAKNYLLIGKGGDVQKVSALDFVVAGQAQRIMRERMATPQGIVMEPAPENKPDPETVVPVIDPESIIKEADDMSDLAAPPSILRGERLFGDVRPVPLSNGAELLLRLTTEGSKLPKDLRDHLITNGDTNQVAYAVAEGLRRSFEQTRIELGLSPSKERK